MSFSYLGLTDLELAAYRTRSLPSWGKGNKQRPVSTADDLEELYAKVRCKLYQFWFIYNFTNVYYFR